MAYRNGTYVAFDGGGELNPADSDRKYYNTLLMWRENRNIDFNFVNSHEKTYQVRDASTRETLFKRLRERLNNSKNMVLIVTNDTRDNSRGVLEYEIDFAVDNCQLPLIIVYPEIKQAIQHWKQSHRWRIRFL